jgi:hypothetical protein
MTQRVYFKAACDPDSQSPQGIRLRRSPMRFPSRAIAAQRAIVELSQRPFLADYDMDREMGGYSAMA